MSKRARSTAIAATVVLLALAVQWVRSCERDAAVSTGVAAIEAAFQEERFGVWVEAEGRVERILPDDLQGSRHQRFILRVSPRRTVLLSHNIDLAPRVPAREGDAIAFRGKYEWNRQGGVVHWTHHDPDVPALDSGGWLLHRGREYR